MHGEQTTQSDRDFSPGDFFSSGQVCKEIAEHQWEEVIQQNILFANG